MDRVALEKQLAELVSLHRLLDEQVSQGYTNYLDDENLSKMKLEKLVIKRKIEKLKTKINVLR